MAKKSASKDKKTTPETTVTASTSSSATKTKAGKTATAPAKTKTAAAKTKSSATDNKSRTGKSETTKNHKKSGKSAKKSPATTKTTKTTATDKGKKCPAQTKSESDVPITPPTLPQGNRALSGEELNELMAVSTPVHCHPTPWGKYVLAGVLVVVLGLLIWGSQRRSVQAPESSQPVPSVASVVKTVSDPPVAPANSPLSTFPMPATPQPGSVGDLPIDTYVATQMREGDQDYDLATLIAIIRMSGEEDPRISIEVHGDGTAVMDVFGEQDAITYDEEAFYTIEGMPNHYTWENDTLTIQEGESIMVFVPQARYTPPELSEETMRAFEQMMTQDLPATE